MNALARSTREHLYGTLTLIWRSGRGNAVTWAPPDPAFTTVTGPAKPSQPLPARLPPHSSIKSAPLVRWWRLFVYDSSFLHHLHQVELSLYVSKRSQPMALLRFSGSLWRNPGRFGISENCGRICPPEAVLGPRMPLSLSLSPKAVDDLNPSTVRENKVFACFFEGRISGSKT